VTPGVYLAMSVAVLFGIGTLIFALVTAPKGEQRARSGQQIPLDRTKVAIARALCVEMDELFDWPSIADLAVDGAA
jgi:hypothetical protein